MKCTITKDIFEEAVSRVEKATGKNLSLTVLRYILLTAKNKTLTLRATNLDIGIEISVPARVEHDGVLAVQGDVLNAFLVNTTGDKVELIQDGKTLLVESGSVNAKLHTVPHEDFPTLPNVKGVKLTLPKNAFIDGLRSVWYSAAPSSMKPELSSVFVGYENNTLVFAATDSFRLTEKKVMLKDKLETFSPILIPIKNTTEIVRNLERADGKVEISFTENQIAFSFENTYLTSRLIDGTFPDYKQIIPDTFVSEAVVLKQDLAQELKVVHVFANKFNQIRIVLNSKKKHIALTTTSDVGEGSAPLEGVIKGEELDISFNYKYITDCFSSITTDSIGLYFSGQGKPLVIKGVGDTTFLYLVMPMNR